MMNLCSPIMLATFFMILADSRQVATRNWELFGSLFNKGLDKCDPKTDYMQYGSHSRVFIILTVDCHISQVLRPDGPLASRAGFEIFQGYLP